MAEALGQTVTRTAAGGSPSSRLVHEVNTAINVARTTQELIHIRYGTSADSDFINGICMFLKPGATDPAVDTYSVLDAVHRKIRQHGLRIAEVILLPSQALRSTRVMVQHYDILNALATYPMVGLPQHACDRFHSLFGAYPTEVRTLGGYEVLEQYPSITPLLLEKKWEAQRQYELATSAFCSRIHLGRNEVIVINGFVPRLMEMYERPESVVVIYALRGDICWPEARRYLLGSPDPAQAAPSSLRNELFSRRAQLGLNNIRLGWNAVHLSAGPAEALVELQRFQTVVTGAQPARPSDCGSPKESVRRKLDSAEVSSILNNPLVRSNYRSRPPILLREDDTQEKAEDSIERTALRQIAGTMRQEVAT